MKQVLECCLLSLSLFLFFSCGKEEEGPIPTDRQVPIGGYGSFFECESVHTRSHQY